MLIAAVALLLFIFQASAQSSKDADKGKDMFLKALDQKDPAKKQDMISKAREEMQHGGLKPQEIAVIMGDGYLEKGEIDKAASSYSSAGKDDKKEGFKKVAEAYVESAFSGDEKAESKALSKAMNYYSKADATKEGARNIGDKFFDKGMGSYDKALTYYIMGDAQVKIEQIAKEYFDKGGDNQDKAAEVYIKTKTPEGYKKAGDIYFDRKEYQKAIEAYQSGNSADGIKKYADYLYSQNRNEEGDNLYVKIAEIYATLKDDEALEKLANECQQKGSYNLASRIYDKAGNSTMSDKSKAYAELIAFKLDSAIMFFNNVGDANMVKTINDNMKMLNPLKDVAENFDEIMRGAPPINMITDSVTGQTMPSASDEKFTEDYYKSVRDQIVKNVFAVSAGMLKLTNPDLVKYARIRFLHYGAVRNILDNQSFAIKKQKADIRTKDVIL